MIIVDDLTKLRREDGLSCKDTILAYCLPDWQVKMLIEIGNRVSKGKLKLCVSETFTDLYVIPHFLAFVNFADVDPETQSEYEAFLKECTEPFEFDGQKISGVPLTYIFNSDLQQEKIPKVMVNRQIFSETEKLRLTLLQEIKNVEGKGKACENSMRIERVLDIYERLLCNGAAAKGDVLSNRERHMFKRDIQSIQTFDPAVRYDAGQKEYILLREEEGYFGEAAKPQGNLRLNRLLWMYRYLLTTGEISKAAVDKLLGQCLSTRTFFRDIQVIRYTEYGRFIWYDWSKKKYVLPASQIDWAGREHTLRQR